MCGVTRDALALCVVLCVSQMCLHTNLYTHTHRKTRENAKTRWDWDRAGVPEALTDELEEKRKEKVGERGGGMVD